MREKMNSRNRDRDASLFGIGIFSRLRRLRLESTLNAQMSPPGYKGEAGGYEDCKYTSAPQDK
jgi:hypothetical protein